MKILLFPYAGASSTIFLRIKKYLPDNRIELIAIDPPGRGLRMKETPYITMDETIDDLFKQILKIINKGEKYVICAHSFGAILSYELLLRLRDIDFTMPEHVFLSGKNAPDIPLETPPIDTHSDAEIREGMLRSGSAGVEIFKNENIAKLFISLLRVDVRMLENYVHKEGRGKLPIDITYFFPEDDPELSLDRVRHWGDFITGQIQLHHFTGGHFFIFKHLDEIGKIIFETISEIDEAIPY